MSYAQILEGIVIIIRVFETQEEHDLFMEGSLDPLILIDGLDPMPQVGWLYDGTNFSAPS